MLQLNSNDSKRFARQNQLKNHLRTTGLMKKATTKQCKGYYTTSCLLKRFLIHSKAFQTKPKSIFGIKVRDRNSCTGSIHSTRVQNHRNFLRYLILCQKLKRFIRKYTRSIWQTCFNETRFEYYLCSMN